MQVRALQAQGPSLLGSHQVEIYLSMSAYFLWVYITNLLWYLCERADNLIPTLFWTFHKLSTALILIIAKLSSSPIQLQSSWWSKVIFMSNPGVELSLS